jgi:hypothetical protein
MTLAEAEAEAEAVAVAAAEAVAGCLINDRPMVLTRR